jgi:hypothetical protein
MSQKLKTVLIVISILINVYWFTTLSIFQEELPPWSLSIYTNNSIIHVYNSKIEIESDSTEVEFFSSWDEVKDRVEELTAEAAGVTRK